LPLLKLYIDQQVAHLPQVVSIRSRIDVPAVVVQNVQEIFKSVSSSDDPVQKGKSVLLLTRNKGAFVKKCPGTRAYTCCGYQILHIGTFCTMDCSYCILQTYFHPPVLQYFVNHDNLFLELDNLFLKKGITRIGTGEFTDSMIWEIWSDLSSRLVPKFSKQSYAVLELKTKTTAIQGLKDLGHNRKTIVAWSLNTDRVIRNEERNTSEIPHLSPQDSGLLQNANRGDTRLASILIQCLSMMAAKKNTGRLLKSCFPMYRQRISYGSASAPFVSCRL